VQTIIPLSDDSGLRLTTARYYTPSGRSIQAKGIVPDIVVERTELPALERREGMHLREKDLENHFEAEGKEAPESKKTEKAPPLKVEDLLKSDFQVVRALDLLKGLEFFRPAPPKP
jgi:carboxyl-terminal processing protease